MAREEWNHLALVLNEIKGFVHLSIALLLCPFLHLLCEFLTISFINDRCVCDSLETWSFVQRVCWELVVRVGLLHLLVNGRECICKIEQEENILAQVRYTSKKVNR